MDNHSSLTSEPSISKMKEVITSLDKATKALIIPILKIKKKMSMKFDVFAKDYADLKSKADSVNKEITTHSENEINDTMNITDIQLNQKSALNHENMISFYQNTVNNIELFTQLFNSNEYDNLIKAFDDLIPENEIFIEEEKVREKEEIKNIAKNAIRLKKPKRPPPHRARGKKKKKLKRLGPNSIKNTPTIGRGRAPTSQSSRQRKLKDFELLEILKKNYPNNDYIKRVSKTLISRRLKKKIIYRHVFDYKENGTSKENKLRSAGETFVYKYGRAIFKFINDDIKIRNTVKLEEFLGKELKSEFAKLDKENKTYIIGGKLGTSAHELIMKIFRKNLYKEYSVVQAVLEFYEFYEELVNDFDDNDPNVKIINCGEITLKNLRSDFQNLQLVRNTIKQIKDSGL